MSDRLKDTWVYQEILREGLEKGLKEGLKEGLEKGQEEERRQELERWRQTLLGVVQVRFSNQKMERLARTQVAFINSPKVIQDLILKLTAARSPEEAQDYLLNWTEDGQESA